MKSGNYPWDRLLWAVEMRSRRTDPMLIGVSWHSAHFAPPRYPGEVTRCLLFRTRQQARQWCAEARIKHSSHSPDWRFRPVRVRETVLRLDSTPPPG